MIQLTYNDDTVDKFNFTNELYFFYLLHTLKGEVDHLGKDRHINLTTGDGKKKVSIADIKGCYLVEQNKITNHRWPISTRH